MLLDVNSLSQKMHGFLLRLPVYKVIGFGLRPQVMNCPFVVTRVLKCMSEHVLGVPMDLSVKAMIRSLIFLDSIDQVFVVWLTMLVNVGVMETFHDW